MNREAMTEQRTPAQVWEEMRRGNERFVSGEPRHPRQDVDRREQLGHTQAPHAALFGCSDSRLAAEIIFDKGLGDLFVVRNAGQVISDSVLGSLEYAVGVLHVPLIVVLGHDECGAVRAAIDSQAADAPQLPVHIGTIIEKIVPAVRRVARAADPALTGPAPTGSALTGSVLTDSAPTDPGYIDSAAVDASLVGREHLRDTVAELLEKSELIGAAIAEGTLAIVGANYRLVEGRAVTDIVIGDIQAR